jgi:hypothetical protein
MNKLCVRRRMRPCWQASYRRAVPTASGEAPASGRRARCADRDHEGRQRIPRPHPLLRCVGVRAQATGKVTAPLGARRFPPATQDPQTL